MLIINSSVIVSTGCRNRVAHQGINLNKAAARQVPESEEKSEYVNYRTFQNPDKTWGFTIFVNNMPFRHYNKIPLSGNESGFVSRKEAETVAELFVKLIRSGNNSPRLTKKSLDTLNITLNHAVKNWK